MNKLVHVHSLTHTADADEDVTNAAHDISLEEAVDSLQAALLQAVLAFRVIMATNLCLPSRWHITANGCRCCGSHICKPCAIPPSI